ncbi:hypothetical protein K438DRAFT_1961609 [Mycena galopus ATCC 62051]|nr:hypothetical protein K438DRAFT_1961609 [Mycena galopus ATCC 62051]
MRTFATTDNDQYTWTLACVPFLASNVATGVLINASGACVFYDATQIAQTHYFNGTPESSVTVTDLFAPIFVLHLHTADAVSTHWVAGSLIIGGHFDTFSTTTLVTETSFLSRMISRHWRGCTVDPGMNVSQALQDLLANATLGVVNLATGNISEAASVKLQDLVYMYDRKTPITTYSARFTALFAMSVIGMFCIIKNGESGTTRFSRRGIRSYILSRMRWWGILEREYLMMGCG